VYNSSLTREVRVLTPHRFADDRGYFEEPYNRDRFESETGIKVDFVQDNQSRSSRGVVRGLHYQVEPRAQGKLVRVVFGAVFDVAVDIRRSSATFGDWFGIELSADEGNQLWIPSGFAHGYLALVDDAEVLYKTTDYYSPDHERSIRWDDPTIGINWPTARVGMVLLSKKDAAAPLFGDAELFT
jgi:dTDP-4-dehydrorhamnose 3,5-epimerase